ncbi:hypothetical protein SAMN04488134_102334 [Amphibacillus marinus]|uniref:Uncharacterized protein n=1 Tax=Amphibacillus marinus TaxID=872970 RepID=A0A1H8KMD1_9BACI|nr:hypothetical protein [Amphibacillus marinus]SEN93871.1 hypothetical protein SAMN04488134_102334 [Amphibacillus marinus]
MKGKYILLVLMLLLICLVFFLFLETRNKAEYTGQTNISAELHYNGNRYIEVASAGAYETDQKLGTVYDGYSPVKALDVFNLFSNKGRMYSIKGFSKNAYLGVTMSAVMETINSLYVNENVRTMPISLFNDLHLDKRKAYIMDELNYYHYAELEDFITETELTLADETDRYKVFRLKAVEEDQWLILLNKKDNKMFAYCREIEYLSEVPVRIFNNK